MFLQKRARLGFKEVRIGGDHDFLIARSCKIKLPNVHTQKDIPVFVIKIVLNQLKITRKTWLSL